LQCNSADYPPWPPANLATGAKRLGAPVSKRAIWGFWREKLLLRLPTAHIGRQQQEATGEKIAMSDLVKYFKAWIPTTTKDRADAAKVIDDQIAALMQNVQDMARNLDGASTEYVEAWSSLIEKRRQDLMELEQVKALLAA
jgi:hypothetical protein